MAIELMPLCTVRVRLKPPVDVGAGPPEFAPARE